MALLSQSLSWSSAIAMKYSTTNRQGLLVVPGACIGQEQLFRLQPGQKSAGLLASFAASCQMGGQNHRGTLFVRVPEQSWEDWSWKRAVGIEGV